MSIYIPPALSEYIWFNGSFVKWGDAMIHFTTHSLHYGGAVFEGERAYEGKIFKLKEHTARLLYSAKSMGLKIDFSLEDIMEATEEILIKNQMRDAYIRPIIWREAAGMKLFAPGLKTNIAIMCTKSSPAFQNNLRLKLTQMRKFPPSTIDVQAKSSTQYAISCYVKQEAFEAGYDDVLMMDTDGFVAESSVSNIFFIDEEMKIYTPIADRFLNGITRQTIINILQKEGLYVSEQRITPEEIEGYSACFLTGTSLEVASVASIDLEFAEKKFIESKFVTDLQAKYAGLVGKKI